MSNIDVGKAINEFEPIQHKFIKQKAPDKHAAAVRRASTEKHLNEWMNEINNTNTREMPLYLVRLYESVYDSIEAIIESETTILERKEV